jgi:hypothetical protein
MPTSVTYYSTPINIEYLLSQIRLNFGDLDGSIFTDTTVRTALVNAIRYLQKKWSSKYQVFETAIVVSPQPPNVPAGYVLANTVDGQAYIPSGLTSGDVFRNPYLDFSVPQPILLSDDETPIVLAATYLLRKARVSSSSEELVSWSTEDIRFTNLSKERSLQRLLEADIKALDDYFRKKLASPVRLEYPIGYIPGLHDIYLSEITDTVLVSREL